MFGKGDVFDGETAEIFFFIGFAEDVAGKVGECEAVVRPKGVFFVVGAAFGVHFFEEAFFFEGAEGEVVDVAVVDFGECFLDVGVGVAARGDEAKKFSLGG